MDARTERISEFVESYDSKLFAVRNSKGGIDIFRHSVMLDSFEYEGIVYRYTRETPHFILTLTDDWTHKGKPVDWGLDQIWMKLQKMDSWKPGQDIVEEINKHNEKIDEIEQKDFRNQNEAFFADSRSEWKKAFNDFNISSYLEKEKKFF